MSPLLQFRQRHGLTQAEAAALCGMGTSSWRQLEGNWDGRQPSTLLLRYLDALGRLARRHIPWPDREDHDADDE